MASALPTTINPNYNTSSKQYTARVLETQFGDGYRQRVADGINCIQREYTLEWIGTNSDIDELVAHFVERAGYQSFTWTPPDESSMKWTCQKWVRTDLGTDVSQLTATLRQEYDI